MVANITANHAEDIDTLVVTHPHYVIQSIISTVHQEFTYTGGQKPVADFLGGAWEGDCATMSYGIREVLRLLGFEADVPSPRGFIHIPATVNVTVPGRTHGNVVEGGWIFMEHYWLQANGVEWDVLFGGIDPANVPAIPRSDWGTDEAGRQ
jgi:hypothetical protein